MADTQTRYQADPTRRQFDRGIGLGLLKGLSVTLRTMLRPAVTVQYPRVKPDLPPRSHIPAAVSSP